MATILRNHYVLAVPDCRASAQFYVEMLGFRIVEEPEGWIFVRRDDCVIALGECPDALPAREIGDHSFFAYLMVDDADAFYTHLKEHGADLLSTIDDKPWGMREFALRTPDGFRIMIGHELQQ